MFDKDVVVRKPLVSFIMGVYNTKNFNDLSRSIDNMLNQTYPEIEVVICDDCSTNGVYDFLLENYGQNEKVTIVQNEMNRGLAFSLNHCLEVVKGNYIARQDDDDYSTFDRIEKQMAFLETHPEFTVVGGWAKRFDENGIWDTLTYKPTPEKKDYISGVPILHATCLFRKESLNQVGNYHISWRTQRGQDADLFVRMFVAGIKVYNLQEVVYFYNHSRGNDRHIALKYRIGIMVAVFYHYRLLKLPFWNYAYALRPVIGWFIPPSLKWRIRSYMKKNRHK